MKSDLQKLRIIYKLKSVYRAAHVDNRHENSAEHSWSALILADYFLSLTKQKIDRLKVYELLMYHDLVEIEAGDMPLHLVKDKKKKNDIEIKGIHTLSKKLPKALAEKYKKIAIEFNECKTIEAKFAQAIDKLDADIHELDYKIDWIGWTEAFERKCKQSYMEPFPELKKMFEETIDFCRKNGFFEK